MSDCDGICKTLFGETFSLESGDGYESWKTDRPMRKEGFNIGTHRSRNLHTVNNTKNDCVLQYVTT